MITQYTIALDRLELMLRYPEPRINTTPVQISDSLFRDVFTPDTFESDFTLPAPRRVSTALDLSEITTYTAKEQYTCGPVQLFRVHDVKGKYQLQYDIEINGVAFGFIRLLPTTSAKFYAGEPLIHLNIDNQVLYSNQLTSLLDLFLSTLNLEINNITRYDIALDSNTDSNTVLIDHFTNANLHFMSGNRLTNNILKVATLYREGQENASFYVGQRGAMQVAFYNKSKQSGTITYPAHIKGFHQANGLDTNRDIYRIEVRVPRKSLKRYKPVYVNDAGEQLSETDWKKLPDANKSTYTKKTLHINREVTVQELTDREQLLSLFKTDFRKMIDFRKKNKANKDRCTRIELIDFKNTTEYTMTTITKEKLHGDTNLIKKQIKNNLENYKYSKKLMFWHEADALSHANHLENYFEEVQAKLRVTPPIPVANNYNTPIRSTITSLFE